MRASYVNPPELLTPVGQWIAARLPHIDSHKNIWGKADGTIFRIYGGKQLYRMCLFNYTSATFYAGKRWTGIKIAGLTVFSRNGRYNGQGSTPEYEETARRVRELHRHLFPKLFYESEAWTGRK